MPASIQIHRLTGAGPTATNITQGNSRHSASDDPNPGAANPVVLPSSGNNRSFWFVSQMYADTTPDGTINNIKWYTDGGNPWSNATMEVGTATAYTQATGSTGTTGNQLNQTNYPTLAANPLADNAFSYDAGSPLFVAGSISNPDTGYFGDYVVTQITISTTTSPGVFSSEVLYFQWDET